MRFLKKFLSYPVILITFLSFICFILFGSLLRHHYLGGERFKSLQTLAVFLSEVPANTKKIIKYKKIDFNKIEPLTKHKNKKRFEKFLNNDRNGLLILPRYDHGINRSIVDVIDLKNFEIIHTYKHNIEATLNKVKNKKEFPKFKINNSPNRFMYYHPLVLKDGSLIDKFGPLYKIDFCSNFIWMNDEENFHHSSMIDNDGNIWIPGRMEPKSQYTKNRHSNFNDDSIIKINLDGEILYNKSVTEILIENRLIDENFFDKNLDPVHLNDIEPVLKNSKYWKEDDVFLSLRHQSAIIHFRPDTNKIINYITGPFAQQHDVDIISDKEISIFNNNNFITEEKKYSEVLIYNFETNEFKKLFNKELKTNNFKTRTQGLSHILKDGSLMVEEQNHGRIILFNNQGMKEWEFVNKDKDGNIGVVSWSRIIEDTNFVKKFKQLVKNKKCKS